MRKWRRCRTLTVIAVILIGFLSSCTDEKPLVTHDDETNEVSDGITGATPNGGKLKSAEEGPVRSALGEPAINLDTYRLTVSGLVDSSYSLSWDEIKELPAASTDTMIMYCVEGWEVWGVWKGLLVEDLLDKAHVQDEGEYILFECRDGYKTALPISYLVKYQAMLAYQVNHSSLQKQNGFPLRLIAFGKYGYKWAKWVSRLEVVNASQLGYWEEQGFSDQADVALYRRRYYEGDSIKPLVY
jgi:DMSO/TMAO reductase YedYZ molybdopterin-dependent catalytic subunit